MDYYVLHDDGDVAKSYGVPGIPHSILIDRGGFARARMMGGTEKTIIEIKIELQRSLE